MRIPQFSATKREIFRLNDFEYFFDTFAGILN